VLIALLLNGLIFNRLNRMVASIEDISVRVAGGDFDAHFEPDGSNDEIGSFEQFFARFLDLVSGTLKSLVK
jgi:methyl-accepting chemotaxis protein